MSNRDERFERAASDRDVPGPGADDAGSACDHQQFESIRKAAADPSDVEKRGRWAHRETVLHTDNW